MSWDYIRDLDDVHVRLAAWASFNRGGVGPTDMRDVLEVLGGG